MLKSRATIQAASELEPTLESVAPEWVELKGRLLELITSEEELLGKIRELKPIFEGSGLATFMAPNGFTGPTYNTTGLGGKPALDFAGGNANGMRTTADVVAIGTGSASSIFMLAKAITGSAGGPY